MSKTGPILLIVIAAVALYVGYLWGFSKGKSVSETAGQQEIRVDTGYQNPFEGVKFNPFK